MHSGGSWATTKPPSKPIWNIYSSPIINSINPHGKAHNTTDRASKETISSQSVLPCVECAVDLRNPTNRPWGLDLARAPQYSWNSPTGARKQNSRWHVDSTRTKSCGAVRNKQTNKHGRIMGWRQQQTFLSRNLPRSRRLPWCTQGRTAALWGGFRLVATT